MQIDKFLRDIQLNLISIANAIQKEREIRLKVTPCKREKRDRSLAETTKKLNDVFKELGYDSKTSISWTWEVR